MCVPKIMEIIWHKYSNYQIQKIEHWHNIGLAKKFFCLLITLKMFLSLNCFSCDRLFATLWTVARQVPLPMGILQARTLELVAMPSSRGSSWPNNRIHISLYLLPWQMGSLPPAPPGNPKNVPHGKSPPPPRPVQTPVLIVYVSVNLKSSSVFLWLLWHWYS